MKSTYNNFFGSIKEWIFDFNEFGIIFSTELTDELRIGMQLFALKLGYLGNDQIMVDWAYEDYRFEDQLFAHMTDYKLSTT
jgi:hypothetical protein